MGKAPRYLPWEWRSLAAGSRGTRHWPATQPRRGPRKKHKSGSRDSRTTFLLEGGKLQVRTAVRNFDLDADTPELTSKKEKLPPFLAKRIDRGR